MAGYTPVFDSVFHGTLCGRWPTLPVWLTILPMADKNGHIDMSFAAMAALTGWPIDLLRQAIKELSEPDPESRSPENDGRRLELIDPETRGWGWRVINHSKYREKARKAAYDTERTASGQDAARKKAEREASRDVPRCPAPSRSQTQTQTQTQTHIENPSDGPDEDAPEVPRGTPSAVPYSILTKIRGLYPTGEYTDAHWLDAERAIGQLLGEGVPSAEIVAAAGAYAAQQAAKGNTTHIRAPSKFFREGYWRGPFPLPAKPETAMDRLMRLNGGNTTNDSRVIDHDAPALIAG